MTQRDPLAQFRRQDQRTQEAARTIGNVGGGKLEYAAYKPQDRRSERLEIRRVMGASHAPSYRYLMDVVYNGSYGTEIVLIYSFLTVKISGRNLQPLIFSLLESRCDFIQDFHPDAFTPVQDQNAPFIEKIEFPQAQDKEEGE